MLCSCDIPQLQHLPCAHVMAACSNQGFGANLSFIPYCAPWYRVKNYQRAYEPSFKHIPDERFWGEDVVQKILPPVFTRKAGRPRTNRMKNRADESREGKRQNICSNCKQAGHYKPSCPNNPRTVRSFGMQ